VQYFGWDNLFYFLLFCALGAAALLAAQLPIAQKQHPKLVSPHES